MSPYALSSRADGARTGSFAIIGGRLEDDNRRVYREMRRLCGGRILVLPTASSEPDEVAEETVAAFAMHGFQAEALPITSANAARMAHDPAVADRIADVGSVYFTGGDQAKILAALVQDGAETPALQAIRNAHSAGGLLAGSSAGAAMMSQTMILGGTSFEAMMHGLTDDPEDPGVLLGKGLGFFPHGLVDQHFIKRGRLARMVVAMAHGKVKRGFGIDENTALIVDGKKGFVCGEYGVFYVDLRRATFDLDTSCFEGVRLSYLDDGDFIDFPSFHLRPSESKRRVKKNEIAYRAPARSQRNAFGAYALYDLVARLVLGDQSTYYQDTLSVYDPKTARGANVHIQRKKGRSRCLIATPADGLRMTAIDMRLSLNTETLSPERIADREERGIRTLGMDLNERSRIVLLGSSPLYFEGRQQREIADLVGDGPVGIFAAASAEARRTAADHVDFFRRLDVDAVDLGVTIDTVEYAARDPDILDRIRAMKAIFLCGGNQIRLVETLLHRGEESAVLRAIAYAYAHGAALIASSGAVSGLCRVMIAGGSSFEALRYGVASDLGHQGLVVQEGVGLFGTAIADQNLLTARRLGRLVVACAEENERFGIGVLDESSVIATKSGVELTAAGRYGFVQVDTHDVNNEAFDEGFVARGVKLRMFGPGDRINLTSGHMDKVSAEEDTGAIFDKLIADLLREGTDIVSGDHVRRDSGARHAVKIRLHRDDPVSATLDLECAREEFD